MNLHDFRPLHPKREEGWSDWLAHLIESSLTGGISRRLFEKAMKPLPDGFDWTGPKVKREPKLESRRADIIIRWRTPPSTPGRGTSIEVKVGDLGLEKTYQTVGEIEKREGDRHWAHFVLLPEKHVDRWEELEEAHDEVDIAVITWMDVAVALRRSVLDKGELVLWRVWALTFCGVIEQRLLKIRWPRPVDPVIALDFLRRSRPDETP